MMGAHDIYDNARASFCSSRRQDFLAKRWWVRAFLSSCVTHDEIDVFSQWSATNFSLERWLFIYIYFLRAPLFSPSALLFLRRGGKNSWTNARDDLVFYFIKLLVSYVLRTVFKWSYQQGNFSMHVKVNVSITLKKLSFLQIYK